jgi:hypothetical protein
MDSALSEKMGALDEKMDNYYSEYKRSVKRLERDVKSLETELEDLDECVDRDTVVDLIHEMVPSLINEKGKGWSQKDRSSYSSESSEESDSVETYVVRERKAIPYKQRRKGWSLERPQARPRKVKILRSG